MRYIAILAVSGLLSACAVKGHDVTAAKDTWIETDQYGLMFCRANADAPGELQRPVCVTPVYMRQPGVAGDLAPAAKRNWATPGER